MPTQEKIDKYRGINNDIESLYPGVKNRNKEVDELLSQPAVNWEDPKYTRLLKDLQATILKPNRKKYCHCFFVTFLKNMEGEAKDWIEGFTAGVPEKPKVPALPGITTAHQQLKGHKELYCSLYLTHQGYKALGLGYLSPKESAAFEQGLQKRTTFPFLKEELDQPFRDEIHAMVLLADGNFSAKATPKRLEQLSQKIEGDLKEFADVTPPQKGEMRFNKFNGDLTPVEWFGFADGISQPRFFPSPKGIEQIKRRFARLSDVSNLKLVLTPDPGGQHSLSMGSFLTFLKLEQNVDAFNDAANSVANQLGIDPTLAEAYLMGRFKNGEPVTLENQKPNGGKASSSENDFDYTELIENGAELIKNGAGLQSDESGSRCPFHAHIRKMNPRLPGTEERRIVRRGIPYDEQTQQNPERVGLLFMSFQRSLEEQFEFILKNWGHNNYLGNLKSGIDAVCGGGNFSLERSFPLAWNTSDPENRESISDNMNFISFKGGCYFFAPSVSFLKNITKYDATIPGKNKQVPVVFSHDGKIQLPPVIKFG
ncbi:MAG: Dyp-type peroxidase [Bacteroidetes bacterium]|nr:Dyp-type peroxidase [Bacteroidota bacterium]